MSIKTMPYPKEQSVERPVASIPVLGLLAILIGGLAFSVLAFSVVTNGPVLAWDVPISQALHFRATHDFWLDVYAMTFTGTLCLESGVIIKILVVGGGVFKSHCR